MTVHASMQGETDQMAAIEAFSANAPISAFFPSLGHQDAINRLPVLSGPGAFVLISGEAGMGKTMLVHVAVEMLAPMIVPVVAGPLAETRTDVRFLRSLVAAAGLEPAGRTGLDLTTELLAWVATLGDSGRTATIIVDDAHRRPGTQFEIIRTLLTAASPATPLSVLLLGEADLQERLNRKRNLARRVSLHYALNPLSDADGAALIAHRLGACGIDAMDVLAEDARIALSQRALGNPGRIVHLTRQVLEHAGPDSWPLPADHFSTLPVELPFLATPADGASITEKENRKGGDALTDERSPAGSRRANVALSGHEKTGAPTPDSSADSNRLSG